ncbi:MAG TPA: secondary thiamine-phosphate synthase enzyme YjbQ [Bacteriovoracaceae bacterium]|nr:secondary thiamine-phosphate synthase enzyme YjbQ [Bacteriovoracaceae bacterium]
MMIINSSLTLRVYPKGFHLITSEVLKALGPLPEAGILHIFIQHTSAALAINENADPTVRHDLNLAFDKIAPENQPFYQHTVEGEDDMPAHIKSVLAGSSVSIPVTQRKLALGTWQGIYLCEFRKDATPRKLVLTLLS